MPKANNLFETNFDDYFDVACQVMNLSLLSYFIYRGLLTHFFQKVNTQQTKII